MAFELPALPYATDALAPHISEQTIGFHYGKHHQAYVTNLNNLVAGTENDGKSLEEIILAAEAGPVFNNAAQIWNHTFYWHSMTPDTPGAPEGGRRTARGAPAPDPPPASRGRTPSPGTGPSRQDPAGA